jgi:uncharacterized protein (TIGR02246 family)
MNQAKSNNEYTAVVAAYRRLLEAWNARDARTYASLFTLDAHVTGFDGSQMNGRSEIESELASIFADHPTASYVGKVREIRSLGPNVTLLRAVVGMIPPGGQSINPAANAIQSLIVVADQPSDEPQIAFFQNTPAAFHGHPNLTKNLTDELTMVAQSGLLVDES